VALKWRSALGSDTIRYPHIDERLRATDSTTSIT
jgi:hypothetical protein